MIEFDKRTIQPEYKEIHIKRMVEYLEYAMPKELARKAESGSIRSERGYQVIAANTCASIARHIGCSEEKAKALSMAVGVYFPKYGQQG